MPERQEQWAVFWCSLLGPLLYGEVPPEEAGRFLNQLAATEHLFPDGQRRRPSRATVWRKWKQYRDGGFEALFRKRRNDRGKPRKATPAMIAKAVELKKEQRRKVHPDFSDVQLNGSFFQVDPRLRGDWIEVRFDPFSPLLENVLLYSPDGEYLGLGKRHQRDTAPDQPPPSLPPKPKHNYLDLLIQQHDESLRQRHAGIDYQAVLAAAGRRWPFPEFVKQLAAHLGRKGGLAAFTTEELESLQKVYQRLTTLDAPMLREACTRAEHRTIPDIVFVL